jgi:two-component system, NarL family, response regulator LiaR
MKAEARPIQPRATANGGAGQATVVLIDDQQLIRGAVRQALVAAGLHVVGEAESARAGAQTVVHLRPDVALMDFAFPETSGIEAIEQISRLAPATRILVLTAVAERQGLVEAIVAGACGYILKDAGSEAIVDGVRAAASGECVISSNIVGELMAHIRERDIRVTAGSERAADAIRMLLTERELEIFKRLASGQRNHEIGHAFSLSENTVKNHVASILAKLHLDNRIQAAVQAVRCGFSCLVGVLPLALADEGDLLPSALVGLLLGT